MDTPAYVIGNISIRNSALWADYRSQVPATLTDWAGELVLRGEKAAVLSGSYGHTDVVVIRFPSRGAAQAWFDSAAYQALIPLRSVAADVDLVVYSGS